MSRNLSDKIVLITGAAHGIGAQVARDLVAAGARVALLDRDVSGVDRLATELGSAAVGFEADVTSTESVQAACTAAVRHFGTLDVVVANAGIAGPGSSLAAVEVAGDGVGIGIAYFVLIDTGLADQMLTRSGLAAVLPGPLGKLAPVEVAASAIIAGISRRARRAYAPRWVAPMLDLRPLLFLADRLLATLPSIRDAVRAADHKEVR